MSRITKFLRQTCLVQPYLVTEPIETEYDGSDLKLHMAGVKVSFNDGELIIEDSKGHTLPNNNAQPLMNDFGEIQYRAPIKCRCRREISYQDIQTSNGSIVKSRARYYLDDSVDIKVDYLIDGAVVLTANAYVNQLGKIEGYEVYV